MEQKQISLNQIYNVLLELKSRMQKIDQYLEDLEFAKRTELAWQEIDEGRCKKMSSKEFLKEIEKW